MCFFTLFILDSNERLTRKADDDWKSVGGNGSTAHEIRQKELVADQNIERPCSCIFSPAHYGHCALYILFLLNDMILKKERKARAKTKKHRKLPKTYLVKNALWIIIIENSLEWICVWFSHRHVCNY